MKLKSYEDFDNLLDYGNYFLSQGASNVYKYLEALSGKFWSCQKLLTYGRPFNFVTSERSVGKSTNIAMFVLLDYVYNSRRFIYCRRDKDTILLTAPKFFDNAIDILNTKMPKLDKNWKRILSFKLNGRKYEMAFMEGEKEGSFIYEEIGCTIALSLEAKSKSTPFGDVYNIIFDEFLERDETKYLGNAETKETAEYEAIMSLYESVDRCVGRPFRNETRVFFLGNIKTNFCPIYMTMGMTEYIVSGSKFIAPKGKYWLMERVDGVDATKDKEQSFSFQLATEEHRKYAHTGETLDDDEFIGKPHDSVYVATVKLEGEEFGIRREINTALGYLYIGKPEQGRKVIALDTKSHNGLTYQLIQSWKEFPLTRTMGESF